MMTDIDLPLAMRMQADGYLMQINRLEAENAKISLLVDGLRHCLEDRNAEISDLIHGTGEVFGCLTCPLRVDGACQLDDALKEYDERTGSRCG